MTWKFLRAVDVPLALSVAILLHWLALDSLADSNLLATVFAAGPHTATWLVVLVVAFFLLRLLALVFLPSLFLAWIVDKLTECLLARRDKNRKFG